MDEKTPLYLLGVEIGKLSIKIWKSLPDDKKTQIKKKYGVHHGEIGAIANVLGHVLSILSSNLSETEKRDLLNGFGEALRGFGEHLMIDDIQDINKWFKPR